MKVTSFEISKKLWDLDFKQDYEYAWEDENTLIRGHETIASQCIGTAEQLRKIIVKSESWFPAYDLETILEALPNKLYYSVYNIDCYLSINKDIITYIGGGKYYPTESFRHKNESLANCAGRLLVKLIEEKLINFD